MFTASEFQQQTVALEALPGAASPAEPALRTLTRGEQVRQPSLQSVRVCSRSTSPRFLPAGVFPPPWVPSLQLPALADPGRRASSQSPLCSPRHEGISPRTSLL